MRNILAAFLVLTGSASASAQQAIPYPTANTTNYTTFNVYAQVEGSSETPTMKARKLARAKALQAEAAALLQQDGGTFTPKHEAYIRNKACDILGQRGPQMGSLVPNRKCGV